jgi:serine/threonine protein kinase
VKFAMQHLLEKARQRKNQELGQNLLPEQKEQLIQKYHSLKIPEAPLGPPEIDPSEIEIGHVLGDGSFGTVYMGHCRQKAVAVKKLLKQNLSEQDLEDFRREIEILSSMFHPNICLFMGACTQPGNLMIVTELMKSDLQHVLHDSNIQLSLLTRMRMAKDIALGMNWLHQNKPPIIHRDLKPSNLLVDENWRVKVSDFGLSQIRWRESVKTEDDKGTAQWMAPELLLNQPYTEKCDVYSFGIVLWELLTRQEPFPEFDNFEDFKKAVCEQHRRPSIPPNIPSGLKMLIQDCWNANAEMRPSFSGIVKRLDNIIVDIAILDPQGNQFWKKSFLTQDNVRWTVFVDEFAKLLNLTSFLSPTEPKAILQSPISDLLQNVPRVFAGTNIEVNLRCLKFLLVEKPKVTSGVTLDNEEEIVTVERFGDILNWFGPLKIPQEEDTSTILDKIRELLSCVWFHGDVSTKEAETMLTNLEPGYFLVRFSTTTPGGYTISKVTKTKAIQHQRISHNLEDDTFVVSGRHHKSLQELIEKESKELYLLYPCTGSKYQSLFVEQDISGYKFE